MISGFFPDLPVLVRPNGYEPLPEGLVPAGAATGRDPEHLRLVHYGMLSFVRVDVSKMLQRLAASGRWKSISFTQYGDDHAGMLAKAPASVEVEFRPVQPWPEVLAGASRYDLAVVVGNWLTGQLPSKAVQYMTLPIPRLALSERASDDALAEYVSGRPGWLGLAKDDPDAASVVFEHVGGAGMRTSWRPRRRRHGRRSPTGSPPSSHSCCHRRRGWRGARRSG